MIFVARICVVGFLVFWLAGDVDDLSSFLLSIWQFFLFAFFLCLAAIQLLTVADKMQLQRVGASKCLRQHQHRRVKLMRPRKTPQKVPSFKTTEHHWKKYVGISSFQIVKIFQNQVALGLYFLYKNMYEYTEILLIAKKTGVYLSDYKKDTRALEMS